MIAKRRTMPEFMPTRLANYGNRIRQARLLLTVIPYEQGLILAGPVDRLPGHRHRDRYVGGRRGDQFPGAAEQRPELRCLAAHDRLSGVPRCKLSMSRGHPSVLRGFGTGSPAACWQSR